MIFPVDMASGAYTVAAEMVDEPGLLKSAAFLTGGTAAVGAGIPPATTPGGWANDTITPSFSHEKTGFGLISNGGVEWADDPNTSGSTTGYIGNIYRNAYDATVIAMGIEVPEGNTCLSISFQFLSEEYPEYVGQAFNDGFIAELDNHTWTMTGSAISAPDNFAKDPKGNLISVNSPIGFSAANAAGSTYDGASPMVKAKTKVTEGDHTVYLSVFDAGDTAFDSTIFIDNIHTHPSDGSLQCPHTESPPPPPPPCEQVPLPDECKKMPPPPPQGRPYEHWFWPPGPMTQQFATVASEARPGEDPFLDAHSAPSNGDGDGDGIADEGDTCVGIAGGGPDIDRDGKGAFCDEDDDGDGILDLLDACPEDPDPDCGMVQAGMNEVSGGEAARGSFAPADAAAAGQGHVQVHEAASEAPAGPLLLVLGCALVLVLWVAGRRRR